MSLSSNGISSAIRRNRRSNTITAAAIAFFKNRWVALWNANLLPDEAKPGQLIHMSTSLDGKTWAAPEIAFASELRSENPIPCDHVQWQPGLIVVDGALWCFWSQLSMKNGKPDEGYGCYFSVLRDPDGKWSNRRLLWDGSPDAAFDQTQFRIFVQGQPDPPQHGPGIGSHLSDGQDTSAQQRALFR